MWAPVGNVPLCIPVGVAAPVPVSVSIRILAPVGAVHPVIGGSTASTRLGVAVPARGAFGPLAVHPFAGVVLGPHQGVEDDRADDGQQDKQDGDGARHPRKTSTTSLPADVVSR